MSAAADKRYIEAGDVILGVEFPQDDGVAGCYVDFRDACRRVGAITHQERVVAVIEAAPGEILEVKLGVSDGGQVPVGLVEAVKFTCFPYGVEIAVLVGADAREHHAQLRYVGALSGCVVELCPDKGVVLPGAAAVCFPSGRVYRYVGGLHVLFHRKGGDDFAGFHVIVEDSVDILTPFYHACKPVEKAVAVVISATYGSRGGENRAELHPLRVRDIVDAVVILVVAP